MLVRMYTNQMSTNDILPVEKQPPCLYIKITAEIQANKKTNGRGTLISHDTSAAVKTNKHMLKVKNFVQLSGIQTCCSISRSLRYQCIKLIGKTAFSTNNEQDLTQAHLCLARNTSPPKRVLCQSHRPPPSSLQCRSSTC